MEKNIYENYLFDTNTIEEQKKNLILVIYDISDNKRRLLLSKTLEKYGFRVQKSAFEAMLPKKLYQSIIKDIRKVIKQEDNVRIYRLQGSGEVVCFGCANIKTEEEIIII